MAGHRALERQARAELAIAARLGLAPDQVLAGSICFDARPGLTTLSIGLAPELAAELLAVADAARDAPGE